MPQVTHSFNIHGLTTNKERIGNQQTTLAFHSRAVSVTTKQLQCQHSMHLNMDAEKGVARTDILYHKLPSRCLCHTQVRYGFICTLNSMPESTGGLKVETCSSHQNPFVKLFFGAAFVAIGHSDAARSFFCGRSGFLSGVSARVLCPTGQRTSVRLRRQEVWGAVDRPCEKRCIAEIGKETKRLLLTQHKRGNHCRLVHWHYSVHSFP